LGHSYVQQAIELSPNLIFLGAGDMAKGAFVLRFQFGGWRLWLMMIEIVVTPASRIGIALGILDGHVGAIERPGEITLPRRLGSRTVGFSPGSVSCSSLKKIVPSGNTYVFLYISYEHGSM